ncbi:hypothetical protein [Methylomonas methanica]|uniref:Uncharacterized protein n=1 Tax=Methylomonas methanica (strain DSM 25384 / MC09) TaxID=857087 RepID=F9ZV45_METMM|nr:hypothetical protein [Methylomonas methanica]AEF99478.1 hypothetical protein Metme_1042 [Methylomonas methanica MC09]
MQELTNEILKGRIEKNVARILAEFQELATRRIERVSQLTEFNFSSELCWLTDDWRVLFGRLSGIRRLFDSFSDDFSLDVVDFVDSAIDKLQGFNSVASDKLLELSRAALARSVEEPVFAPTTESVETVLLPSVVQKESDHEVSYPPKECLYCHQQFTPVAVFGGVSLHSAPVFLSEYCSDECWHAHQYGEKKMMDEAA